MLVGFCEGICQSTFLMDRNDNQFVNVVYYVGSNHTHHPTGVPRLEGMVGGTTLERVSGLQLVGVNDKKAQLSGIWYSCM